MALAVESLKYFKNTQRPDPLITFPDLLLEEGEWLVVWGGNGSGKSTLAAILAGWIPELLPGAQAGSVYLDDQLMGGSVADRVHVVQYVQQVPQWQLSGCAFTVEEEIAFGPENLGLPEEVILTRMNEAIEFTDCQALRERHPATLSGGELQRVILACALAMKPRLLLLDEAFSRMTGAITRLLLDRLHHLSRTEGMNVILFERHVHPAKQYCHQAVLLRKGIETSCYGTIDEILPVARQTIIFSGCD